MQELITYLVMRSGRTNYHAYSHRRQNLKSWRQKVFDLFGQLNLMQNVNLVSRIRQMEGEEDWEMVKNDVFFYPKI